MDATIIIKIVVAIVAVTIITTAIDVTTQLSCWQNLIELSTPKQFCLVSVIARSRLQDTYPTAARPLFVISSAISTDTTITKSTNEEVEGIAFSL